MDLVTRTSSSAEAGARLFFDMAVVTFSVAGTLQLSSSAGVGDTDAVVTPSAPEAELRRRRRAARHSFSFASRSSLSCTRGWIRLDRRPPFFFGGCGGTVIAAPPLSSLSLFIAWLGAGVTAAALATASFATSCSYLLRRCFRRCSVVMPPDHIVNGVVSRGSAL